MTDFSINDQYIDSENCDATPQESFFTFFHLMQNKNRRDKSLFSPFFAYKCFQTLLLPILPLDSTPSTRKTSKCF